MNSATLRLCLIYLLVCPWFFGFITISNAKLAATDFLLIPGLVLLGAGASRKPLPHLSKAMLAYAAVAMISTLQWFDTDIFVTILLKAARLFGIIFPAVLVSFLPLNLGVMRRLMRAFYWGGLISALIGIIGFYANWEFTRAMQSYTYGMNEYRQRAGGVFGDSGAYGHLLATWFAVFISYFSITEFRPRWVGVVVLSTNVVILLVGLYVSMSRSALLDAAMILVGYILLPKNSKLSKMRIVAMLLVAATLGPLLLGVWNLELYNLSSLPAILSLPLERIEQTFTDAMDGYEVFNRSAGGRLNNWQTSLNIWLSAPVIGIGYKALIAVYNIPGDNNFVLALAETGTIGGALYCLIIGLAARGFWRYYSAGGPAGRPLLAMLAGQVVHSTVADTLTFPGSTPALLVFCVLVARITDESTMRAKTAKEARRAQWQMYGKNAAVPVSTLNSP